MNKIALFFDKWLSVFFFFGVGFVFGAYYTAHTFRSIVTGIIFALTLTPPWLKLINKNQTKNKEYERYEKHFVFAGEEENLKTLYSALSKRYAVTLESEYIATADTLIFCKMTYAPLSVDDAVTLCVKAKSLGYDKVVIATISYHPDCSNATAISSLKLWNYEKVFSILHHFDALPQLTQRKKPNKLKEFLKNALSRDKSKHYFRCALTLFILSSVTAQSVYYIVVAVACTALGITAKVLPSQK